ncbi:MAG: triose-phosphate isomerase [Thermodesulfovibrionales bacterium]
MNKTVSEARGFIDAFLPSVMDVDDADIVIAPPFTSLYAVAEMLRGTKVKLSAQDVFYEEKGAFTGEVSPIMLRDVGCEYVIVGHSERRRYFKETDEIVNRKIRVSLKNGLGVIFCIGESLSEREAGKTYDVLKRQLEIGLKDVDAQGLVVAYEPVWAIGTGRTATPDQAQDAHRFIRGKLREVYGSYADSVRILYGGSVTPENIDALMACPDVDGALVGGASLMPDSFERIVKFKRGTE